MHSNVYGAPAGFHYLRISLRIFALAALLFCLNACAADVPPVPAKTVAVESSAPAPTSPPRSATLLPSNAAKSAVNLACATDADCVVKNVGNCCGYYPGCVNKDSPTFPEQVRAQCRAQKMSGVCGFPSYPGCQCQQHTCVMTPQSAGGGAVE